MLYAKDCPSLTYPVSPLEMAAVSCPLADFSRRNTPHAPLFHVPLKRRLRAYESVATNSSARPKLFCMKRRKADSLLRRFEQRLKEFPDTMSDYERESLAANVILAQEKRIANI